MEESFSGEELRDKLIIAGIGEIESHGFADFSLRRVANACGASCAAPYRHFKNKESFLFEIVRYINNQWALLEAQIEEVFREDTAKMLLELCMANIRFRIANSNFRAVLMIQEQELAPALREEISHMAKKTRTLCAELCRERGLDGVREKEMIFTMRSYIYGAALMIHTGEMPNSEESMALIRARLRAELERA